MPGGPHPPLSVILNWPLPNYVDPVTRGWGDVILCIALYVLALVTVLARLRARLVLQKNAGLDDLLIVIAMVPLLGLGLSTSLGVRLYGFDRHVWDLTSEMAIQSRKAAIAIEECYVVATALTKISILLFYRRLADGSISRVFRWAVLASIAFVAAYMVAFFLVLFVGCRPFNAYWNSVDIQWAATHVEGVDYVCFNEGVDDLVASIISIIQDFLTCGMPALLFWKLQVPRRQKIALGAIFGVGFFLCITGIIRCLYIHKIFFETYDVTWFAWDAWAWTVVEANVAVVCASAPALKVFFKEYLNVSAIGSGLQYTFKRTGYQRTGYGNGKSYADPLGTVSSASGANGYSKSIKGTQTDLEIGRIEVTKEVDINMEETTPESWTRENSRSEERYGMSGMPATHIRKNTSRGETPWLDLSPTSEGQPSPNLSRPGWR